MMNNKPAMAGYEQAKTSVWWDIENFPVPKGFKAEEMAQKISSVLSKLNYNGPISIFAYGNMNHIPPSVKKALTSTGIALEHQPSSFETGRIHLEMSCGMSSWKLDNPAPANVMIISRDEPFPDSPLDPKGYNVLLAHSPHPSPSLLASANTTFLWRSILEEPINVEEAKER